MQQMVRAGILRGVRGPRGGYRLARERRRIAVADIVTVVRGLDGQMADEDERATSALGEAVVQPFWDEIEAALMDRLNSVTIEVLCRRAERTGVPSEAQKGVDFVI
jgi:Rrf2 family protein